MKLEDLALCTREEFEQELSILCPEPTDNMNPGEYDAAFNKRVSIRSCIKRLRIEALLDGKLTVDQVVEQESSGDEVEDLGYKRILEKALEKFKDGKGRYEIIEEIVNLMELI